MPRSTKVARQSIRIPFRETASASFRAWKGSQEDKASEFEMAFAEWIEELPEFDSVAKERLYENHDFTSFDLRWHRLLLGKLIASGEHLAIDSFELVQKGFLSAGEQENRLRLIDEHLHKLTKRMHDWHGAPEDQSDIPAELHQSFLEARAGDVLPFPEP